MSLQWETNNNEDLLETGVKNPSDKMKRFNLPKVLYVSFHFISVLTTIVLATYLVITKVVNEKHNTDLTNLVCFSCDFISGNTEENIVLLKEGNRCCATASEGYKLLERLISNDHSRIIHNASPLQDGENNHKILDVRNSKPVAAHVYINVANISLGNTVLWNKKRIHSFVTNGLNYSERTGIMTVIQPGIYYVYSQLIFNKTSALSNYDQIYQQITLKRANKEELLLFWKQTINSRKEFIPSVLEGNFQLQKDDQIYVNVSDPNFLYKFGPANFFGLHSV